MKPNFYPFKIEISFLVDLSNTPEANQAEKMSKITHQKFKSSCGELGMILTSIVIFCAYLFFKYGYDISNAILVGFSIISILGVRKISILGDEAMKNTDFDLNRNTFFILEFISIWLLSGISGYIFFYKGVYELYLSFRNFSILSILWKILIIISGYRLFVSTYIIQGALKSIESNDITRS